ncbi:hypothetical protein HDU67_000589 [Dinochytrium kinnereticum]|nr:hypothetical protein HDU67_000589 [Dinochytrium kinnereticum]
MAFFQDDRNSIPLLESRIRDDCTHIERLAGPILADILRGLLAIGAGLSIAITFSWRLTLVSLLSIPAIGVMIWVESLATIRYRSRAHQAAEAVRKFAIETIYNIRIVTTLSIEDVFKRRFETKLSSSYESSLSSLFVSSLLGWPLRDSLVILFSAFGLYAGGYFLVCGQLDQHSIWTVLTTLTITAINSMGIFSSINTGSLGETAIAATRIFDLIERQPIIDIGDVDAVPSTTILQKHYGIPSVDFKDVNFSYSGRMERLTLHDFTLHVPAGQTLVILGESGSGLYDAKSGNVLLDGVSVPSIPLRQLRSRLAIVWQETDMFNCSVSDNIALGYPAELPLIIEAAKAAGAHEFIQKLPDGYETIVGEKGALLSGGQRQRLAIARAYLRNPELLLLDEATSALDSQLEDNILGNLCSSFKSATKIIVTHKASAARFADLIAVVHAGSVREVGTRDELLSAKGLFWSLTTPARRN